MADGFKYFTGAYAGDNSDIDKHNEIEGTEFPDFQVVSDIRRRLIEKAKEWREADNSEPIGSRVPSEKLKELAFIVDELKEIESL
jgi:hypothetical protein